MPLLSLDDKREIVRRLGYRLEVSPGSERGSLIDPDGRHKGMFLPCKATDTWAWNDAVFRYKLSRHRDGGVYKRLGAPVEEAIESVYEHIWPDERKVEVMKRDEFEDLGGSLRAA